MSSRPAFDPALVAAPRLVDGVLDLSVYRVPAAAALRRGDAGRATVAAATVNVDAGSPLALYARAGERLTQAFAGALPLAGLELDPNARPPRIQLQVARSTRRPGDTPTVHACLLLLAHVRLVDRAERVAR